MGDRTVGPFLVQQYYENNHAIVRCGLTNRPRRYTTGTLLGVHDTSIRNDTASIM